MEPTDDGVPVRVAVRVRPLITRELLQGSRPCITTEGPCVTVGRDRRFTYDLAFGPTSKQEEVYRELVRPLVDSCFDGYNVTVLAYGQTGSGKTFTMGTGECGEAPDLGVAPRVVRQVFNNIEAKKRSAAFYVRAQFLEIYNEEVRDLLAPPPPPQQSEFCAGPGGGAGGSAGQQRTVSLRDAGDGSIMVIGAREEPAECADELLALLERGMAARATSSNYINEQSSRSHAILTIILEQHMLLSASCDGSLSGGAAAAADGGLVETASDSITSDSQRLSIAAAGEVRIAKLHLVDLAGSERTKQLRSSQQGPRFRETVNINQGLLALGNVISALGDERRRGSHVPYRESKLTRLLQDSLGGNSRTAMIACVSCADDVLEETLNTLKYANRARNIRNKPVVNRANSPSLSPLRGAVQEVQLQVLKQLAAQLPGSALSQGLPLAELAALDMADPAACLDVLSRMKAALLAVGGAEQHSASDDVAAGAGSDRGTGHAAAASLSAWALGGGIGSGGSDVDALVESCSRAIGNILRSVAEMEAQGHVDPEARKHILRSLDSSTLGLLPAMRTLALRPDGAAVAGGARVGLALAFDAAAGQQEQPAAGPRDVEEMAERVRSLESELAACRSQLQEAREDLERDEVIFADKMKELADAKKASAEAHSAMQAAEERHAKEVTELKSQLAAIRSTLADAQRKARQLGSPALSSRSRRPPQSGSLPGEQEGTKGSATAGGGSGDEDEVLYDEELLSYISDTDYLEETQQRRREATAAVLESDAVLREELAEVLRQKAAAEAERAALERAALAQRSSFDSSRAALEEQLQQLSASISAQQQQLEAAQEAERAAKELAAKWQERAEELEGAIAQREAAVSGLRSELAAVEGSAARSSEERQALRKHYEQRIAAAVAQVSALQRQLQQHTSAGDRRDKQQTAERAAAMEAELARMRTQQCDLRKQLAERVSRFERDSAARVKELAGLRRAAQAARSRIAQLEQENAAQRALLRQKQQEVAAAQQRLAQEQRRGGDGVRSSASSARSVSPGGRGYNRGSGEGVVALGGKRSASVSPGRGGRGPGDKDRARFLDRPDAEAVLAEEDEQKTALLRARSLDVPDDAQAQRRSAEEQQQQQQECMTEEQREEQQRWGELLLEAVVQGAAVEARLAVLDGRRQELLRRRDSLMREQSQFLLRTQRRSEQLVEAVAQCESELAGLVMKIPSPRFDSPTHSQPTTPRDGSAVGAAPGAAGRDAPARGEAEDGKGGRGSRGGKGGFGGSKALLTDDWVALQQRIADVSHTKAKLEEQLAGGRLLDEGEQQVLDSLDDQLDDLETQLSYIDGEVADRRAALEQLQQRRAQLEEAGQRYSAPALRAALGVALEAVGQRAAQVRQLETALAASEAGAARREARMHVRLRESLISLSAHLASMEASSPGSSTSLTSTELRSLLGVYLGLGAAQQGPPAGAGAGVADADGEDGPTAPGRPPHLFQRSASADGLEPDAHAVGPETASASFEDGGGQQREQDEDAPVDLSMQSLPLTAMVRAPQAPRNFPAAQPPSAPTDTHATWSRLQAPHDPPCHGPTGELGLVSQREAERATVGTPMGVRNPHDQGQPQSQQQHSYRGALTPAGLALASSMLQGTPSGGILRRASMESTGSAGSAPGSAKRVTWGPPSVAGSSGAGSGAGAAGRGGGGSILDQVQQHGQHQRARPVTVQLANSACGNPAGPASSSYQQQQQPGEPHLAPSSPAVELHASRRADDSIRAHQAVQGHGIQSHDPWAGTRRTTADSFLGSDILSEASELLPSQPLHMHQPTLQPLSEEARRRSLDGAAHVRSHSATRGEPVQHGRLDDPRAHRQAPGELSLGAASAAQQYAEGWEHNEDGLAGMGSNREALDGATPLSQYEEELDEHVRLLAQAASRQPQGAGGAGAGLEGAPPAGWLEEGSIPGGPGAGGWRERGHSAVAWGGDGGSGRTSLSSSHDGLPGVSGAEGRYGQHRSLQQQQQQQQQQQLAARPAGGPALAAGHTGTWARGGARRDLSAALQPYKERLRRAGEVASGRRAGTPTGLGSPARPGVTHEAGSGVGASPVAARGRQHSNDVQRMLKGHEQDSFASVMDAGVAAGWQRSGAAPAGGAGGRLSMDERQAASLRAARQKGYLP